MASVSKQIRKSSKLRKKILAAALTLSLVSPVIGPQVGFAQDDQGYTGNEGDATPYTGLGAITTYKVKKAEGQPEIEVADQDRILSVDGKKFRDADGDGSLDAYEDWRKPVSERAADLISKMDLTQKAGMMYINTHTPVLNPVDGQFVTDANDDMIVDKKLRHVIYRQSPNVGDIANYNNQMQELAENLELGIPVVITSNPRNSASTDYTNITNVTDQHTFWPGTLGLAAGRDTEAVREFAEIARQEWRNAGIRKVYGYGADIATDPLWARIEETFGEDPELTGDMIYEVINGFQGEGETVDTDSVAITVKHFPGGGARDDGQDPHFENGNFNIYPTEGSMKKYHIPPFEKAIAANAASVMPYYAYPSNLSEDQGLPWYSETQQFEEVGMTLNKGILDYLRSPVSEGGLGYKGYVNSDSGAVGSSAWGALDLSLADRVAKAVNAGTNIISGGTTPELVVQAVNSNKLAESKVDESITFTLTEMMNLGLFEDPYVNPQEAIAVVNDEEHRAAAYEAHQKSVVLMRNDKIKGEKLLPLTEEKLEDVKLYVEGFAGVAAPRGQKNPEQYVIEESEKQSVGFTANLKAILAEKYPNITIVDSLDEATHAYVYVQPVQSNWDNNPRISVGPETGVTDVDAIVDIQKKVPTITAVNFTNQWLINELEPNAAAFIGTFGTLQEAVFDVITGEFNPVGKLPFAIPASAKAVEREVGDVPSFAPEEDPSFVYLAKSRDAYAYNFGLSYDSKDGQTTISDLKQLITEKLSKHGHQKSLVNQIEKAEKYLASGNTARAISTLNDTKKKVDQLPKNHVTNEVKQEINQAIDEVIANLKSEG